LSFVNSLINTAVYVVVVLVVIQILYHLFGLMSKYDKTKKGHSLLYGLFAAALIGYILLRNLSSDLSAAGLFAGLGLMGLGLLCFSEGEEAIQSIR
jgi:multiple sugar transport system permease protein